MRIGEGLVGLSTGPGEERLATQAPGRVELADAVPLLGDEAEVHRPPSALENRLEDAVVARRVEVLGRIRLQPPPVVVEHDLPGVRDTLEEPVERIR